MGAPVVSRSGPTRSDYKRLDELAAALQAQGRASEAEDAYRKALDIARQMPEDLDALQMATGNLVGSLYDQARYDEVIPLFEEWQDVNEQGFGADDLRGQVGPRRWLTNSYMLAGRYEDARSTLGARLASAERTFAPGSAWIVLILATLAIVSQVEGKVEDARRYADRAVETARQRSGVLRSDTDALTTAISAAMDSSKSYVEREKALYEACQSALLKESAPAVAIKPVPTLKHPIGAGKCGACGAATDLAIPTAARQPFLDALRFDNPVTLQAALAAGEAVLVQCHATVGGLIGTNRRVLCVKKGSVYLFSYEDVEDLCVEKVGWFMNATCQLITHRFPHQPLKAKDADEAPNAFSIVRNQISTWEAARSLMLEIRDSRRCPHCGGFVSLQDADSDAAAQPSLVEPLTFGESETLTRALQPEEQVLCQIHAARFAKALVATDRRVLVVMGGKASSIPYSNVSDVVVTDSYVRLVLTERPDRGELKPLEVVKSDDAVPCGPEDRAKFEIAADLIRQRAGGRAPAV